MKHFLAVLSFALIFSSFVQTTHAATYNITEYEGNNGFISNPNEFLDGDILNITNNIFASAGGPIYSCNNKTITIKGNGHTIKGYELEDGKTRGFFAGGAGNTFTIENAVFTNFKNYQMEPIVVDQNGGTLNFIDSDVFNNTFIGIDSQAGAVRVFSGVGFIKAINKNVLFANNGDEPSSTTVVKRDIYMTDSELYLLPSSGKNITLMGGIAGNGYLHIGNINTPTASLGNYTGTLILGGNNECFGKTDMDDISVIGATVKLLAGSTYFNEAAKNNYVNGTLDLQNGVLDYIAMNFLTVFGDTGMNMKIDIDLEYTEGDYIRVDNFEGQGTPVIKNINLLSDSETDETYVHVLDGPSLFKYAAVLDPSMKVVDGRLYSYNVDLINYSDPNLPVENPYIGNLKFTRNGLFSRPVMGASYAVQGVRLLQEELAYILFENTGNFSFFEKPGASAGDIPRDKPTMWLKGFAVDSEIDFNEYGKADADYFGAMAGLDIDRLYEGFDATYGLFGTYVSGKQKGDRNDIEQSGGYFGGKATFYFDKLFLSGILDAGLLNNSVNTAIGTDEFNSSVYAATLKGGYNFELSKRSFTLQPNIAAGFSYVNTEDYTNKAGVKIESDDVSIFTLMPGVKLAKNLGKCWILSGDGHYVYSSVSGDLKADSIVLADNEYDNYFRYSACIEKIWGYTVAHLRLGRSDGGRSGWNLSAGVEWKF